MKIVFTEFNPSAALCIRSYGYEDNSSNAHWGRGSRDVFILHYVMSGEGFFNSHRVKCGQGFFITPGMIHEYHSSEGNPWKYFWVIFSGKDAAAICEKYIATDENGIFDYKRFELKLIDLANHIMMSSGHLTESQSLGYFYLLLSCHEATEEISGNRHVEQAEKYMKTHIYRSLTITEIATAVGISDRYLYNLFMKHRGISPKQYLNELKIKHARELLKTTSDTISEIAVSTGFNDVLTFSRFFRKEVGVSPSVFRQFHS